LFPSNLISSIGNTFKISNDDTVKNETTYNKQMAADRKKLFGSKTRPIKNDNLLFDNILINDQF
jgi:hypothetical protein